MLFSHRKGLKPAHTEIQVGKMNAELRNSLWNVLDTVVWDAPDFNLYNFTENFGFSFLKIPIDTLPAQTRERRELIRKYFFSCEWYEVYDFLEFVVDYCHGARAVVLGLNSILQKELAGYRIISGKVTDITDKQEVKMLEEELRDTRYAGVSTHLKRALELLSDRRNPDYRNSIKESISAVESIAKVITGKSKATLGEALTILEKNKKLHKALEEGFKKLYGYTNDEGGVRHGMLEEPDLTVADAKFFLLSCTSFVNYLKSKV